LCLLSLRRPFADIHAGTRSARQHDFDFNIGVWHTHIKRILDPFASSSESVELYGTVTVRKVWDGKAELEEIEADGPKGHWEGLTLFLYNPGAQQWTQSPCGPTSSRIRTNMRNRIRMMVGPHGYSRLSPT
jgi:hypothetical protein